MGTSSTWLIGVVLCTISSFGTGLSKLAIRKSWLLERGATSSSNTTTTKEEKDEEDAAKRRTPIASEDHDDTAEDTTKQSTQHIPISSVWTPPRMRYAALLFMTFGNPLLDIGAFAFCSPSILAPFSGVSLAWVVLLSRRLVGERPEPLRVLGAGLIMTGEVLIALFGDHSSHNHESTGVTIYSIKNSYMDPPFVKYLMFAVGLEAFLLYTMRYNPNAAWQRFAWGVAGGFSTGFQNFIKDAITVVQLTPVADLVRPWRLPWFFFGLLAFAAITAGGGLAILAACMKRYDATYASGTFAGSLTLCASIMSALHYHTFDHLNNSFLYLVGLGILIVGVGLLMHHSQDDNNNQHGMSDKILTGSDVTISSSSSSSAATTISDEETSHLLLLPEGNSDNGSKERKKEHEEQHEEIELSFRSRSRNRGQQLRSRTPEGS